MSCQDLMSLEDFQPSLKTEVDQVKDKLTDSDPLEMEAEGHNGLLITDSGETGSQKTGGLVLPVIETDTVVYDD